MQYSFLSGVFEIPFPHTTIYWGEKIAPLHLDINNAQLNATTSS